MLKIKPHHLHTTSKSDRAIQSRDIRIIHTMPIHVCAEVFEQHSCRSDRSQFVAPTKARVAD